MNVTKQRNDFLSMLKGIASLFVVFVHVKFQESLVRCWVFCRHLLSRYFI